jgi:hypothetical protein
MAFTQLALHTAIDDSYSKISTVTDDSAATMAPAADGDKGNPKPVEDQANKTAGKAEGDSQKSGNGAASDAEADQLVPYGRDVLFHNGGISIASILAQSPDPTTRRQGVLSLAQMVELPDAKSVLMADGFWKPLKDVCERLHNAVNIVDIDACRNAAWVLYSLSEEGDIKEELANAGVLGPLMKCLGESLHKPNMQKSCTEPLSPITGAGDRFVKKFAAKAVFNLADNENNAKLLLKVGLDFLVHTATTRVAAIGRLSEEEKDAKERQEGAAEVLCKLSTSTDDGMMTALEHKLSEGKLADQSLLSVSMSTDR